MYKIAFVLFGEGTKDFFVRSKKMRVFAEAYVRYAVQKNPKSDKEMAEKDRYPAQIKEAPPLPYATGAV